MDQPMILVVEMVSGLQRCAYFPFELLVSSTGWHRRESRIFPDWTGIK